MLNNNVSIVLNFGIILSNAINLPNLKFPLAIPLIFSSAYLLVFHGSLNPSSKNAALNLVEQLNTKFKSNHKLSTEQKCLKEASVAPQSQATVGMAMVNQPLIEIAALELTPVSLQEKLIIFARKAHQRGFQKVKILPLFLSPGVHVQEDIPVEVFAAIKKLKDVPTIELLPYLGKYSGIVTLLSREFSKLSAETRVLVAHGSRLSGVARHYRSLANQLGTSMAYWSTTPSLEDQILTQIKLGKSEIAIMPYFLFPGKITKIIKSQITQMQQIYPHVKLCMGQPLGETEALAELIFEMESR